MRMPTLMGVRYTYAQGRGFFLYIWRIHDNMNVFYYSGGYVYPTFNIKPFLIKTCDVFLDIHHSINKWLSITWPQESVSRHVLTHNFSLVMTLTYREPEIGKHQIHFGTNISNWKIIRPSWLMEEWLRSRGLNNQLSPGKAKKISLEKWK
jgi:hypothetical protein